MSERIPAVQEIEMVDYSAGYEQPAEPMWRVQIDQCCADFSTKTAAECFRDAILSIRDDALSAAQAEIARLNADEEQIAKLETAETLSGYCAMFSKLLEQGRSPEGANAYVVARATFDYTTKVSVMEAEIARLKEALEPYANEPQRVRRNGRYPRSEGNAP